MRSFLAAVILSLALAGCVTTSPNGPPQTDAERAYLTACSTLPVAHAAFLTIAAVQHIDAKSRRIEAQAYAAASAVCSGPMPRDIPSALAAVLRALETIKIKGSRA